MTAALAKWRESSLLSRKKAVDTFLYSLCSRNSFYKSKLEGVSDVHPGRWLDLPFTSKSELVADQEQHPPFGSNLTYCRELSRGLHPHQSHERKYWKSPLLA